MKIFTTVEDALTDGVLSHRALQAVCDMLGMTDEDAATVRHQLHVSDASVSRRFFDAIHHLALHPSFDADTQAKFVKSFGYMISAIPLTEGLASVSLLIGDIPRLHAKCRVDAAEGFMKYLAYAQSEVPDSHALQASHLLLANQIGHLSKADREDAEKVDRLIGHLLAVVASGTMDQRLLPALVPHLSAASEGNRKFFGDIMKSLQLTSPNDRVEALLKLAQEALELPAPTMKALLRHVDRSKFEQIQGWIEDVSREASGSIASAPVDSGAFAAQLDASDAMPPPMQAEFDTRPSRAAGKRRAVSRSPDPEARPSKTARLAGSFHPPENVGGDRPNLRQGAANPSSAAPRALGPIVAPAGSSRGAAVERRPGPLDLFAVLAKPAGGATEIMSIVRIWNDVVRPLVGLTQAETDIFIEKLKGLDRPKAKILFNAFAAMSINKDIGPAKQKLGVEYFTYMLYGRPSLEGITLFSSLLAYFPRFHPENRDFVAQKFMSGLKHVESRMGDRDELRAGRLALAGQLKHLESGKDGVKDTLFAELLEAAERDFDNRSGDDRLLHALVPHLPDVSEVNVEAVSHLVREFDDERPGDGRTTALLTRVQEALDLPEATSKALGDHVRAPMGARLQSLRDGAKASTSVE